MGGSRASTLGRDQHQDRAPSRGPSLVRVSESAVLLFQGPSGSIVVGSDMQSSMWACASGVAYLCHLNRTFTLPAFDWRSVQLE